MGLDVLRKAVAALVLVGVASTAMAQSFEIKGYRIEGGGGLPAVNADQVLKDYMGPGKTLEDARAAAEALRKHYTEQGYGLVRVAVPAQESPDGVIVLKVQSAAGGQVAISGAQFHDEANIRASLPALQEGGNVNVDLLATQLRLANENPSKQTVVTLAPAGDGTVNADVKVSDQKTWKTFIAADNSGTPETGRTRMSFGYQNANVLNRDHILTMQYTTSPEKFSEVKIFGLGYQIPIYSLGHSLDFYYGYSDVDSGMLQDLFAVSAKGQTFGVRYNQNFAKRGLYKDKIVWGLDYRKIEPFVGVAGLNLGTDLTLRPLSVSYVGNYVNPGKTEGGFYITAVRNIDGGSHGGQDDFEAARTHADPTYWLLRYGASVSRMIGASGWMGRAVIAGQYTSDALVTAEQFGVGGADSVRGFYDRQVISDKGYRGSFELYTPDWGGGMANVRGLAFFDWGNVKRNHALASELESEKIASVGLGLRVAYQKRVSFKLDYAHVTNGNEGGLHPRDDGDDRVHASFVILF